jgi:hypothetical protein
MRPPRTSLLLLPAGLTLGHAVGYLVGGRGHHEAAPVVGHGYLAVLVRLAVPLAAGALGAAFAGGARRRDVWAPRWDALALQLAGLFLVVEVAEHALAGVGPAHVLHAPTTLWGLVGQALAAWVVTALVRVAHRAGRRVAGGGRQRAPHRAAPRRFPRPAADRAAGRDAATWVSLRAPPTAA